MKFKSLITIMLFIVTSYSYGDILTQHSIDSHNAKREDNQPAMESSCTDTDTIDFMAPIEFSADGIKRFLEHIYNHPVYANEILPNNFLHFTQFLHHITKTKQPASSAEYIIRLFHNKLKASPYVNAYSFVAMMQDSTTILSEYLSPVDQEEKCNAFKIKISDLLQTTFVSQFSSFKENPISFLDNLSDDIFNLTTEENRFLDTTSSKNLRTMFTRFIDSGLNKLIWAPEDHIDTWNTVKIIANQLTILYDKKIIDDIEELNDLFITLLERYCFFIELTGVLMPLSFYEKVAEEISSESLLLLELPEQEQFLESKTQRLTRALFYGESQAQAHEENTISQ